MKPAYGEHLIQEGPSSIYYVFILVPPDVQPILKKKAFKRSTGTSDLHQARTRAAPIITGIKQAIQQARETLKPPAHLRAEVLAEKFQALNAQNPAEADRFALIEIIKFVLAETGQDIARYPGSLPGNLGFALPPNTEAA